MSDNEIRDAIATAIADNEVILFMKGSPAAPACGFSARTVAMLEALETPFAAVDVLPDPRIRQELSAISKWPTIPQLFHKGELIGGCDIVTEMYESGELADGARRLAPTRPPRRPPAPTRSPRRWASRTACSRSRTAGRVGLDPACYRVTATDARVAADPQVRIAVGLDVDAADRRRDAVVALEVLERRADVVDGLGHRPLRRARPRRRC